MFIEYAETPNPNTLKFLPNQPVLEKGTRDYKSAKDAEASPLALKLFEISGVEGVFLGSDFVSVSKNDDADWAQLRTFILAAIQDHFMTGLPVLDEKDEEAAPKQANEHQTEIERQIVEILETRIQPAVAMDGGNIEYVDFDDGVVYLRMEGACAGCPSATMTLKHSIENLLKHYIPEVVRVEPEQAY